MDTETKTTQTIAITAELPVLVQEDLQLLFEANGAWLGNHGIQDDQAMI